MKPWPVCIFSLYIIASSESDEGLVSIDLDEKITKILFIGFCYNQKVCLIYVPLESIRFMRGQNYGLPKVDFFFLKDFRWSITSPPPHTHTSTPGYYGHFHSGGE